MTTWEGMTDSEKLNEINEYIQKFHGILTEVQTERDILKRNVHDLEEQLRVAYKRISELKEGQKIERNMDGKISPKDFV